MEASSTTLNISGPATDPTPKPDWKGHTHQYPNFGRFVAGCAKCEEKYPQGPPPRKVTPKPQPHPDVESLAEAPAAATPAGTNDPALIELVKMMLSEKAEQVTEKQAAAARLQQSRDQMLKGEQERIRQIEATQAICESGGHKKENGRTAIAGQIHNDGLRHLFCQRCFKTFPPQRPAAAELANAFHGR